MHRGVLSLSPVILSFSLSLSPVDLSIPSTPLPHPPGRSLGNADGWMDGWADGRVVGGQTLVTHSTRRESRYTFCVTFFFFSRRSSAMSSRGSIHLVMMRSHLSHSHQRARTKKKKKIPADKQGRNRNAVISVQPCTYALRLALGELFAVMNGVNKALFVCKCKIKQRRRAKRSSV